MFLAFFSGDLTYILVEDFWRAISIIWDVC